uniref:Uncharacterized protein n=2 Tax=Hemiselmis andersenii TaxID=464988 RepID=A0A7S0TGF4_HEMAN
MAGHDCKAEAPNRAAVRRSYSDAGSVQFGEGGAKSLPSIRMSRELRRSKIAHRKTLASGVDEDGDPIDGRVVVNGSESFSGVSSTDSSWRGSTNLSDFALCLDEEEDWGDEEEGGTLEVNRAATFDGVTGLHSGRGAAPVDRALKPLLRSEWGRAGWRGEIKFAKGQTACTQTQLQSSRSLRARSSFETLQIARDGC